MFARPCITKNYKFKAKQKIYYAHNILTDYKTIHKYWFHSDFIKTTNEKYDPIIITGVINILLHLSCNAMLAISI